MKLRGRLLAGSTVLVLLPLLALAFGIRHEMGRRLTGQVEARMEAEVRGIETELRQLDEDLAARVDALVETLRDDNRVRIALQPAAGELPPAVLDWAGRAMTLTGLDLLQLQDDSGRILSSGHFRNEYDRRDPETLRAFTGRDGPVLLEARRDSGAFVALARHRAVPLGSVTVHLVAGREADGDFLQRLARGGEGRVTIVRGDLPAPSPDAPARALELPTAPGAPPAHLVVTHSLAERHALLRSLDLQLLGAWGLAALGAMLLAVTVSRRFTRPIERLAESTAALDLDRLDARFPVERDDEVGALARFLDAMTRRLRAGVARLQETERRATLGELARQVNHDLRNAVTPLRNVVRHLNQVADESPAELAGVYRDRRGTLDSGLQYLESLAGNWRRLAPRGERVPCDLEAVVRQVAAGRLRTEGGPVTIAPGGAGPATVLADPVGLRRIVENLVANACESLESAGGTVEVGWRRVPADEGPGTVRLHVRDTGRGIAAADRERIFDDFYTTKPDGQGLGLSVVRRLVSDFEGSLDVSGEPGRGTEVVVNLPAAG